MQGGILLPSNMGIMRSYWKDPRTFAKTRSVFTESGQILGDRCFWMCPCTALDPQIEYEINYFRYLDFGPEARNKNHRGPQRAVLLCILYLLVLV